jgi:hypothetical protein
MEMVRFNKIRVTNVGARSSDPYNRATEKRKKNMEVEAKTYKEWILYLQGFTRVGILQKFLTCYIKGGHHE